MDTVLSIALLFFASLRQRALVNIHDKKGILQSVDMTFYKYDISQKLLKHGHDDMQLEYHNEYIWV
jgi:hypothetical protein